MGAKRDQTRIQSRKDETSTSPPPPPLPPAVMATYRDIEKVKYLCDCGKIHPICWLYLCRHCFKLRCGDCLLHEVDSHFCPCCLENLPSTEAKLRKNRCGSCFDCPSCGHLLSTRATNTFLVNPEDPTKNIPKKMYYLACGFCRWTTRDIGIGDKPVATGGWQDLESPHLDRVTMLLEYYKKLSLKENSEKEREKFIKRRGHIYYTDKFGLATVALKRKALNSPSAALHDDETTILEIESAETVTEFPELDDEIFSTPIQLNKVTTIDQRLSSPEFQPVQVNNMYPRHKHLQVRKSVRCKKCDHNLIKPDYNSASTKFKIQSTAMYHVPELRISDYNVFSPKKEKKISLTLSNPAIYNMDIEFTPVQGEDLYSTARVELPKRKIVLARRDEDALYEGTSSLENAFDDDPAVIVSRKLNKIVFLIGVTPIISEGKVRVAFVMRHSYKNVTLGLPSEKEEVQTVWLEHAIYAQLGQIQ